MKRRNFLINSGKLATSAAAFSLLPSCFATPAKADSMFFDISLAQWSLHRQIRSGALKALDFPIKTKKAFDINAVEYVNQFFADKAKDKAFLSAMKMRAADHGVQSLLIMIDAEGELANPDKKLRLQAVENHKKWVEAAQYLGCHSIRVNAAGPGNEQEVKKAAIDGMTRLSDFAKDYNINIIIENHGGHSANGRWLADILQSVNLPNCGSLPDFGNFGSFDRYQGVKDLMPYAKGISAKSFTFNDVGNELTTDYSRMLSIIKSFGYKGHIGIEFEGKGDEEQGIRLTKDLLVKLGTTKS